MAIYERSLYELWRIDGARQGRAGGQSYGLWRAGMPADRFEQLLESHGEGRLGVEYGRPVEFIDLIAADTTFDEQRFDILARVTGWGETWAQQRARLAAQDAQADEREETP